MKYSGKLFGKVGSEYIPLIMTADEVDALEARVVQLESEIIDRHARSADATIALREVKMFCRHDEDCQHNSRWASVRRCTCGRDAAWETLLATLSNED